MYMSFKLGEITGKKSKYICHLVIYKKIQNYEHYCQVTTNFCYSDREKKT